MVTIIDIAKISKCSVSTVSKALNNYPDISDKTRRKIVELAADMGYVPNSAAQSLVKRKSNTIGVVYQLNYGLKSIFFSAILDAFRENIEKQGYDIMLLSNNSKIGMDYLEHSQYKQVDAVLILASGRNQAAIKRMREGNLPVLIIDPPTDSKNSIYSDSYHAIQSSCKYLFKLGHRKIAFIQGDIYNMIGKQRYDGYLDFIKENGLEPIYNDKFVNYHYSIEEGYHTMQSIFEDYGLPDAVCCSSDLMAIGAMNFLKLNGFKVPDDVSIIGFDDLQICEITEPKLTTIKQDYDAIGKIASDTLVQMIEGIKKDTDPIILPTEIIVRDSCKRR